MIRISESRKFLSAARRLFSRLNKELSGSYYDKIDDTTITIKFIMHEDDADANIGIVLVNDDKEEYECPVHYNVNDYVEGRLSYSRYYGTPGSYQYSLDSANDVIADCKDTLTNDYKLVKNR